MGTSNLNLTPNDLGQSFFKTGRPMDQSPYDRKMQAEQHAAFCQGWRSAEQQYKRRTYPHN